MSFKLKVIDNSKQIQKIHVYKIDGSFNVEKSDSGIFYFTCYPKCSIKLFHNAKLLWNYGNIAGEPHYVGAGSICYFKVPIDTEDSEATLQIKNSGFGSWFILRDSTGWVRSIRLKLC